MASDPIALLNAFKTHLTSGDRAAVNQVIAKMLADPPPLGARWKSIATVAQHNGEVTLANAAMARYAAQAGNSPIARFEQAGTLAQTGRLDEAAAIMAALPETVPDRAGHHYIRGTIASNLGNDAEAKAHLRAAADADPYAARVWLVLTMHGALDPADAARITAVAKERNRIPEADRGIFDYAYARHLATTGDTAAAFDSYARGAAALARERPYDPALDRRAAADATEGWTETAIAALAVAPDDTPPPIFVTGLPRSGTTLVEQILVSNSSVRAGEELEFFRLLERDLGGKRHEHMARYVARTGSAEPLRALYRHLANERHPGSGRIVDKSLSTSRYLGIVASIFPDAPIIWLRRDPLDCAWSAFSTYFQRGVEWSHSLEHIAEHFRIEDALFAHWTALFPERILVVDYPELVRDPEAQIGRIAQHCGLDLEPAMLAPHETTRSVTTASVHQVREPINARGIGSAEPYRAQLAPFLAAYQPG